RHLRDHAKLLKILLAENRKVRSALREQFADNGCDTAEKMRPEAVFQTGRGRSLRHDPRGKAARIHRLDLGVPDQLDLFGRELAKVGLPRSWIGTKILGRRKLRRVDEDRDDHPFCAAPCEAHQRHMPVMECTHGWNEGDGFFSLVKAVDGATQYWDR